MKNNSSTVERKPKLFLRMLCIEILGKKLFFKINFYETTLTMTMCSGPICTLKQVNTTYLILLLTALHTTLPQQ